MQLKRVLIANRGEIAVRVIRTCKELCITPIAVYAEEEASSSHVTLADEAYQLKGEGSQAYLDIHNILQICRQSRAQAVIPGYGFLSENAEFVEALTAAGLIFIGPSADALRNFGLKHHARELATAAGVPVVPGTGVLSEDDDAVRRASEIGYPVMVKATAGGGGMGLQVCHSADEVESAVQVVRSRGSALFKNPGLFLEKYIENGRHIEAQIFGNGQGDVLFFGERECSLQRRHQKVLEETPSPFVLAHPELRERLKASSVSLAASVQYKSAGTVEYLVDNDTGDYYFLEMNTRLQVEHGITELCYDVDLVKLMLLQAEQELAGAPGLSPESLHKYARTGPQGHAIEVRIYAENPAKDFCPAPGLLQNAVFPAGDHQTRVDTWISTGTVISPFFDPLLAKLMVHGESRGHSMALLQEKLEKTVLQGPPTNTDFLLHLSHNKDFQMGHTLTTTLEKTFAYQPCALEFMEPGAYTTVQDYPGRVDIRCGVPVSGPMDDLSFRLANIIAGNPQSTEGFEITLKGPRILFHSAATIAVCGAPFSMTIDHRPASLWTRHRVKAGSIVAIGETAVGSKAYLAVRGGLTSVAEYLGSKSTTPATSWGGYQGRTIRTGDFLSLDRKASDEAVSLPDLVLDTSLIPHFEASPNLYALPGPYYSTEFLAPAGQKHLFESPWKVSFNSNRSGIRLEGPPPEWGRTTGGEGGSHPSNVLGYGYPLGGVSFTGDAAVVFPMDCANTSGFMCSHAIIQSDLWRLGQARPGDILRFQAISWSDAALLEKRKERWLNGVENGTETSGLDWSLQPTAEPSRHAVLYERAGTSTMPRFIVRQAGDRGLLLEYGYQTFDLAMRARIQQMVHAIMDDAPPAIKKNSIPDNSSLLVSFDPQAMHQEQAVAFLVQLEASLPTVTHSKFPSRVIRLPLLFDASELHECVKRYMETQRPYASYLPDNVDFIRRSNGLATKDDVKQAFVGTPFIVNTVGWMGGLPIYIQVDPRRRLSVPKYNPSRTITPAGATGTGGNTSSIYPLDSPGGYVLWGMTLPGVCWDTYGRRPGYREGKPWFFEAFDQIIFYAVERDEFDGLVKQFKMGHLQPDVTESEFDMAAYNRLVRETADEVAEMRKVQERCTAVELAEEAKLLEKWKEEQASKAVAEAEEVVIHDDPSLLHVTSTMNGRVWKVLVEEGDEVKVGDDKTPTTLAILESMKMEIPVHVPDLDDGDLGVLEVVQVIKKVGDLVEAGDIMMLLKVMS